MIWPSVRLDRAALVSGGGTPRRNEDAYWNGDVPWVTPSDLPAPGASIVDVRNTANRITEQGLASCAAPLLPPGTVLFSSRATIGKIAVAGIPLATNQGFANFTPNSGVEPKYLAYALRFFTPQIAALAGATTFKEVTRSAIRKFQIPLPPPSEQRRIIELLDQADVIQRTCEEANEITRRILPALFGEMFGDLSTNTMGWPVEGLGSLVSFVSGGTPPKKEAAYWDGNIPWVSPKDMKPDQIDKTAFAVTELALRNSALKLIPENSVLIVVRGMILTHTVPIRMNVVSVTINQDMKALLPRPDINPFYLRWALQSRHLELLRLVSTAAHGTRKIDIDRLSSLSLPVPPPPIQEKFAQRAIAATKLLARTGDAMTWVRKLLVGLTHQAFSGDLTADWRDARVDALLREAKEHLAALGAEFAENPRSPRPGQPGRTASC